MAAAVALAACGQAPSSTSNAAAPLSSGGAVSTTGPAAQGASAGPVSSAVTTSAASPAATTASEAVPSSTSGMTSSTTPSSVAGSASSAASAIRTTASPAGAAATSSRTASSAPATAAVARGVKLTIDPSGTQGSYQVQEQLAGHDFTSQAIGRTSAVAGAIVLDANGTIVPSQSNLTLDLRTLKSDQSMRDNYIQHDPLQTAQYPLATFAPSQATGLAWPLPASGTAKFDLAGDMTVHGTTKPLTWSVTATFGADKVTGTATTPFTFTEFGMQPPRTMIALSVKDGGTLELQFAAGRTAQ